MSWESLVELKLCEYVQRVCINMYQNLYIQKGTIEQYNRNINIMSKVPDG